MNKYNKIFVIGLNKTASTTIHNLFKANKFKSIHWQTQLFEKKYQLDKTEESVLHNKENNKHLLDKELDETFQVFSDIQNLSLNFELLDKQYPNSLFIYNYRNVNSWVLSRLNHHTSRDIDYITFWKKHNKKKHLSDNEVIEEWINLYNTHQEKVLNYFKNKENIIYYNIEEECINKFINKLELQGIKIYKTTNNCKVNKNKKYKFENNEFIKIVN